MVYKLNILQSIAMQYRIYMNLDSGSFRFCSGNPLRFLHLHPHAAGQKVLHEAVLLLP